MDIKSGGKKGLQIQALCPDWMESLFYSSGFKRHQSSSYVLCIYRKDRGVTSLPILLNFCMIWQISEHSNRWRSQPEIVQREYGELISIL